MIKEAIDQTAADVAARISNLKELLRSADYTERAGLREEISALENYTYPEAVERETKAARDQRAATVARINADVAALEVERQPHAARRMALTVEIDQLIRHIPARDSAKARQLADVLRDIANAWDAEGAIVRKTDELTHQRDTLNKAQK